MAAHVVPLGEWWKIHQRTPFSSANSTWRAGAPGRAEPPLKNVKIPDIDGEICSLDLLHHPSHIRVRIRKEDILETELVYPILEARAEGGEIVHPHDGRQPEIRIKEAIAVRIVCPPVDPGSRPGGLHQRAVGLSTPLAEAATGRECPCIPPAQTPGSPSAKGRMRESSWC